MYLTGDKYSGVIYLNLYKGENGEIEKHEIRIKK